MTNKKLDDLMGTMLEKLDAWRSVANELNEKTAKGQALTSHDLDRYFSSDKDYMEAKRRWENCLKELYQQ